MSTQRAFESLWVMTLVGAIWPVTGLRAADLPKTGQLRFERHELMVSLNEGIAVADVNRDGKVDLIAGPHWFEGPAWKQHPLRDVGIDDEEFFTNNGDHAIDLNGDGWVDVISASWFSDKIFWYENPGKEGLAAGKKWQQRLMVDGQPQCEGTLLEDLNGDGIPELLVNSWDEKRPLRVVRIKPGVKGELPAFEVVELGGPAYGHGLGVGDINGDGRKDVFVPEGWFEAPPGDVFASKWKFHELSKFPHVSIPCLIVDVNRDGKNDLIIGQGHDYGLRWLEQGPVKDGEITWTTHEIDKSFSQAHCLVWADLDGDGQKELITGKRWRGHKGGDPGSAEPVCLLRYVWNPATGEFQKDVISYDDRIGTGMQICVADLDGDKKLDIAVAGKTGTHVLLNRGPANAKSGKAGR